MPVDPRELAAVARSIDHRDRSAGPWLPKSPVRTDAVAPHLTAARRASVDPVRVARAAARSLLEPLPDGGRRWRHTEAVAGRARVAGRTLPPADAATLEAAAWLHDIGYAPGIAAHHFHPADGADHVRDRLDLPAVAGFVAHHSGARFVAAVRELTPLLERYDESAFWTGPIADALTWADQTTDPAGHAVDLERRLAEMLGRHGTDSPNARAHLQRTPALRAAVAATEARLAAQPH